MLAANFEKLSGTPTLNKKPRISHLTTVMWKELIFTIREPADVGYQTRVREKSRLAEGLEIGQRVNVMYLNTEQVETWHKGTIVTKLGNARYEVFYDAPPIEDKAGKKAERKVQIWLFEPLGKDSNWDLLTTSS